MNDKEFIIMFIVFGWIFLILSLFFLMLTPISGLFMVALSAGCLVFFYRMLYRAEMMEDERKDGTLACRETILSAVDNLQSLIRQLGEPQRSAISLSTLDLLLELAPLYPMSEVLYLQGYAGKKQEDFLQRYFMKHLPRYSLRQFLQFSIEREGPYEEWYSYCGLDADHCGRIWHTLIELVCRQRDTGKLQTVIDQLGAILYQFSFLEDRETDAEHTCYQQIIRFINQYGTSDQQTPYLHAVMLLQVILAKKLGGQPIAYIPILVWDEKPDMDGGEGLCFQVKKRNTPHFLRRYAVRTLKTPDDPDLIWELPDHGDPVVILNE